MAFESLSEKLETTFRKLKGKGRLTEMDINEAMRDVRLALLEADVNFKLVKDFVNRISEKSKNKEVLGKSVSGTDGNKNSQRRAHCAHGQ